METFDRHQLDLILASEGGPHVTVFLPAPAKPFEAKQDAIRISNLAREAHARLVEHWLPHGEAEDLLKPLYDLSTDSDFLSGRRQGVAIYLSEDFFKVYRMDEPSDERLFVARTFCLRAMLAGFDYFAKFFVLRLSKKGVTLFSATPQAISEVEGANLPESFEETLVQSQISVERGAQTHSASSGIHSKQGAVFHGQGGKSDAEKAEITEYLKHVDKAVSSYLQDRGGFLILAGVDYLTAIYQQINSSSRLVARPISGNVDHLSTEQLLQQAMPIAVEEMQREREADAIRIREQRHAPVTTEPEQILSAAYEGRIDTLFFKKNGTLHGSSTLTPGP